MYAVGDYYKNINTGEVLQISRIEYVKSYPQDIRVWVLSDGSIWNDTLFFHNWRITGQPA